MRATVALAALVVMLAVACGDGGAAAETTDPTAPSTMSMPSTMSTTSVGEGTTVVAPTSDGTTVGEAMTSTVVPTTSADTTSALDTSTGTASTTSTTSGETTGTTSGGLCDPGASRCTDATVEVCNPAGDAWEEVETCDPVQGLECVDGLPNCMGACSEALLGSNYIGCDFYPTVTLQHDDYNIPPHQFAVTIANTTDVAAEVVVTRGPDMVDQVQVPPGSVVAVVLPWVDALTKGNGPTALVAAGAYRLRSTQPVTVYQYNPFAATVSNDASLLLPVNVWGRRVVVASSPEAFDYPGFYAVVAAGPTEVTLTPSATGGAVLAGAGVLADGTGVVHLEQGDVLQVVTDDSDLTGTVVEADRPVQVIGGSKCLFAPVDVFACDHSEESMFPVDTLATEYVVVPPAQYPNGQTENPNIVRVIATEADTTLTFTPDQPAAKVLANVGDFVELAPSTAKYMVTADKKVLVSQFMLSAGSHPAFVLAITPSQYRSAYLFHAPPSWESNFVDITAPKGTAVQLDGAAVGGWTDIAGTAYSYTHVKLSNAGDGNHSVTAPVPVGISVYGLQQSGSYWYPGGLALELIPG